MNGGFICDNCGKWVEIHPSMGTDNRNHCNFCLWSKHVDNEPGDRKSKCMSTMKPVGLILKQEGIDKYGKVKLGEVMLVHECTKDGTIKINRIAADDNNDEIISVFESQTNIADRTRGQLKKESIHLLEDRNLLIERLFGKGAIESK